MKILSITLFVVLLASCEPAVNKYFSYHSSRPPVELRVSSEMLTCDCHSQGVGWDDINKKIVVTCRGDDGYSYIILFEDYGGRHYAKAIDIYKTNADRGYAHPSAIQIENGIFPVALSEGKSDSSIIQFFKIEGDRLTVLEEQTMAYGKHLGACTYFNENNQKYIIGIGWNARDFVIWKTSDSTTSFEIIAEGDISSITDQDVPAYNSIWYGSFLDGRPVLMASSGSLFNKNRNFLDFYDLDLSTNQWSNRRRLYVSTSTKGSTKSLFYEGVSVKNNGQDSCTIISVPQDFSADDADFFSTFLYEGSIMRWQLPSFS